MVVQWVDTRKAESIRVLAPQRRQVSYFLASVRANIRKATRTIGELTRRIRPRRGRMLRLRDKVNQLDQ
mgnify:FL=1